MATWFFQLLKIKILVLLLPPLFLIHPTSYLSANPAGSTFKIYLDQFGYRLESQEVDPENTLCVGIC